VPNRDDLAARVGAGCSEAIVAEARPRAAAVATMRMRVRMPL